MNPITLAITHAVIMLETNTVWQDRAKWAGTAFIILASIFVSFSIEMATLPYAYAGFLCGHIIWFAAALIMRDKPLITLNGFFLFVDSYAIMIRL